MKKVFCVLFFNFFFLILNCYSQDPMKMLDSTSAPLHHKVIATFKTARVVNLQTTQTVHRNELDFRITHRFGSIGVGSNGGVHTLYGWDAIQDVRLSFDYGITDKLQIGISRNKKIENIDGSLKWRFLEQTTDNKIPVSITAFGIASITPERESALYAGADSVWIANNKSNEFAHRIAYTTQLLIARKFSNRFSFEIAPSYTHRNYVLASVNPANGKTDENGIFSVGAGFRMKLSGSFSVLADYFYIMSDYRTNNSVQPYYSPLSVGIEIETGGHVFHMNFSNASGIIENYFIPNTTDSWTKGGYKFGFDIWRTFSLGGKKKS